MPHKPHSPQATTIALHIRWNLHTLVTLQRLSSPLDPLDPALAFTHASPSALSTTTTFLIVSRLSTKVALLASPTGTSYAAKFYDTDQAAAWHVRKELAAYTTAQPVWGRSVPVFYGAWRVLGSVGVVLLMEAIVPGVPVGSLEVGERRGWHGRAVEAVREMNKAGVRHRGLSGER